MILDIINLFIFIYFFIIAINIIKAYCEYLKVKGDDSKVHRIEIKIPLPNEILNGLCMAIKNLLTK